MEQQQLDEETGTNFRLDLLSSLLGQQIASGILNYNTIDDDDEDRVPNSCPHPVFIGNSCTKCGQETNGTISTIPFWYIYPRLNVCLKEVNRIRDTNLQRLLSRRKLHLVVDLDHTLVHTRKLYKLSPEDRNFLRLRSKRYGVDYNLAGELGTLFQVGDGWTKLRPFVREFLREASTMFDITIYTLGCRAYAWDMSKLLDPDGMYFDNWRVISREDCVALDKHKKCLDVVLEHERVVVVMDDNEAVWEDHKTNLFKVTPYNYFSYFSPEDKVHDASPPRLSWSQLNGDESGENGVLAMALDKLRLVHQAFFDDNSTVKGIEDYGNRDVRQVLQRVLMKQKSLSKKQKKQQLKKINYNGLARNLQAAHL
ncbi:hypothetical protein SOVF_185530 [Spinacia oleracea]|uniref:RNA polymerase II C-terminal domain phosphatase-like n=1 Tax=Spinacia oleracea TaxID=3562 RepID=A0A9R0HZA9_SPIOL|nr:RNA polymerase II C-terminal domain phosphatase-like 4 [Spinacia oleracea]KNA05958.1 hypothetical protein SOVF_185530 [Spinacia oleracea]